jgi:hypothetical protein
MIDPTIYGVVADATGPYSADLYHNVNDAVATRDRIGGDAHVYRMTPLTESAHWDWAVDIGDGREPMVYVSEQAARNCVGRDGKLLRRRCGATEWQAVAP